jgi:thiol-disulfide isomerase/thioredoxin
MRLSPSRLPLLAALLALSACSAASPTPAAPPVRTAAAPFASSPAPALTPAPRDAPAPGPTLAQPAIRGERGDLPLFTLDGGETKLALVGARVTVIAVWGASCVPCLNELPYVDALYQAVQGDPSVAVLTLVVDDVRDAAKRQAVREIAARLELHVPVLFDRDIAVYKRLNGEDARGGKPHEGIVIPQLVIVDPAFSLRRTIGFKARDKAAFVAEYRALIDLAREGRLPPEDPPLATPPPPDSAALTPDDAPLPLFVARFCAEAPETNGP